MIILDTNVVSELLKVTPDTAVRVWALAHSVSTSAITVVTVMEILHGIERMPDGQKREVLARKFEDFRSNWVGDVLYFDEMAAEETARYRVARERSGRPLVDLADAQIAGIVLAVARRETRPVTLATRNVGDFTGLTIVNPWAT